MAKKQKWIKIYLIDGSVEQIDYGYQMSRHLGDVVFTRIKDGEQKIIPLKNISKCVYNSI
jgi:hypothetical protein